MFTGLSAFPLTPFHNEAIDFNAFEKLLLNLSDAKVDSICAMGSTGLYPYIDHTDRKRVIEFATSTVPQIPVMAGIGALRTYDVLKHAESAQHAGAKALLLAPVSYHPLHEDEVFSLYYTVCNNISVPLVIYENPGVTQFTFSDSLYTSVSYLPNVSAIKIPGMPFATEAGASRLSTLREQIPEHVAVGVSGDKYGSAGMAAGCDLWLSVLGGLFPKTVLSMIEGAKSQTQSEAMATAEQLEPLWQLFLKAKGGMRVMATAASILGYTEFQCLPAPLKPFDGKDRQLVEAIVKTLS